MLLLLPSLVGPAHSECAAAFVFVRSNGSQAMCKLFLVVAYTTDSLTLLRRPWSVTLGSCQFVLTDAKCTAAPFESVAALLLVLENGMQDKPDGTQWTTSCNVTDDDPTDGQTQHSCDATGALEHASSNGGVPALRSDRFVHQTACACFVPAALHTYRIPRAKF
jgi:hypothetical protein